MRVRNNATSRVALRRSSHLEFRRHCRGAQIPPQLQHMLDAVLEIGEHSPLVVLQRVVSAATFTGQSCPACAHSAWPPAAVRSLGGLGTLGESGRPGAGRGTDLQCQDLQVGGICSALFAFIVVPAQGNRSHVTRASAPRPLWRSVRTGTPHRRHTTARASGRLPHLLKRRFHPLVELSDFLLDVPHERRLPSTHAPASSVRRPALHCAQNRGRPAGVHGAGPGRAGPGGAGRRAWNRSAQAGAQFVPHPQQQQPAARPGGAAAGGAPSEGSRATRPRACGRAGQRSHIHCTSGARTPLAAPAAAPPPCRRASRPRLFCPSKLDHELAFGSGARRLRAARRR